MMLLYRYLVPLELSEQKFFMVSVGGGYAGFDELSGYGAVEAPV
jgi:hypothetical protein